MGGGAGLGHRDRVLISERDGTSNVKRKVSRHAFKPKEISVEKRKPTQNAPRPLGPKFGTQPTHTRRVHTRLGTQGAHDHADANLGRAAAVLRTERDRTYRLGFFM